MRPIFFLLVIIFFGNTYAQKNENVVDKTKTVTSEKVQKLKWKDDNSHLILHFSNRFGKPKEGVQIFQDFVGKKSRIEHKGILAELYINTTDCYYFSDNELYTLEKLRIKIISKLQLKGETNTLMKWT
ncbi:hypothetical protein [Aquimarina litoralis]|uniref:hypothetical protein n=1 Tax=Aquimarina litoralis TaxID=584605 RepID=UPI001C5872B1|nr:hypothetical protein [Aquimarina litoralis]MBW1298934.1 hypothetical protein [Aquimarina litoralis]